MINNLIILTGNIQSGKTTRLLHLLQSSTKYSGILMPIVAGKRHFYDIKQKKYWQAEADIAEEDTIEIGKYKFAQKAFEKANEAVVNAVNIQSKNIVIDEIGPLETKYHQGFYAVLQKCFNAEYDIDKLILVTRKTLLSQVQEIANGYCNKQNIIEHPLQNTAQLIG